MLEQAAEDFVYRLTVPVNADDRRFADQMQDPMQICPAVSHPALSRETGLGTSRLGPDTHHESILTASFNAPRPKPCTQPESALQQPMSLNKRRALCAAQAPVRR